MRIHFIGIGGTAIGPLALISHQMGHTISGSDKQNSQYVEYLKKHGINNIYIGNSEENIAKLNSEEPIDWLVYSSAIKFENPNHPEILYAENNGIKVTKRDELLNQIIKDSGLKLIAIAGTHGKTTTTAMAIWLFKKLGLPISYSVGAKIPFGDMGHYDKNSKYFVYECDEFDYNFLSFSPFLSLITGVDYDHHEIYKTREDYRQAFQKFLDQSEKSILWEEDIEKNKFSIKSEDLVIDNEDKIISMLSITGLVNRKNAYQVMTAVSSVSGKSLQDFIKIMEDFPGLSRRFEKLVDGLYTDYAHTIPKIEGCLQLAKEVSDNVVIVYEPLTNRRQYFIKDDYRDLFNGVKKLYWVPTYLAREDPNQSILTPDDFIKDLNSKVVAESKKLDEDLKNKIEEHIKDGDIVVCMSGGGGNSLDEWLRNNFE
jgi:UDP-N-acetylmuramate--alanine ligase